MKDLAGGLFFLGLLLVATASHDEKTTAVTSDEHVRAEDHASRPNQIAPLGESTAVKSDDSVTKTSSPVERKFPVKSHENGSRTANEKHPKKKVPKVPEIKLNITKHLLGLMGHGSSPNLQLVSGIKTHKFTHYYKIPMHVYNIPYNHLGTSGYKRPTHANNIYTYLGTPDYNRHSHAINEYTRLGIPHGKRTTHASYIYNPLEFSGYNTPTHSYHRRTQMDTSGYKMRTPDHIIYTHVRTLSPDRPIYPFNRSTYPLEN